MFHDIPKTILDRMRHLEELDALDRTDGTPRLERLRQIPAETGRFLALLAASAPQGRILEVGTSAGYSTLWLALAARATGRKVLTYEVLDEKAQLAAETFRLTGVEDVVELVHGDARDGLSELGDIALCFVDAEKEDYPAYYDLLVPQLAPGGLFVADNLLSHKDALSEFEEMALNDPRVDALVVPVGKGELVCRRI